MRQLETFEGDVAAFDERRGEGQPSEADRRLVIRFFNKAVQDMEETREKGRPVFKEVTYIQIMVPGDRESKVMRPMTWADKSRFAKQFDAWSRDNSTEGIVGTPLEAWGILSLAQIEELRYYGIRTVDHLADLRDDVVGKIMGAPELKNRAKLFIQATKENAPMVKMQEELSKRDNDIEALKKALAEQGAALARLQSGKK